MYSWITESIQSSVESLVSSDPDLQCQGPFWRIDRINTCHLQRYVDFYPLSILLGAFLIYTLSRTLPGFVQASYSLFHSLFQSRSQPLLTDNQSDDNSPPFSPSQPQSPVPSERNLRDKSLIDFPANRSDKKAFVVIKGKSITDKFRLVCELILSVGDLVFAAFGWLNPEISDYYLKYAPNFPLLFVLFSAYTTLIVLYRVIGMNSVNPLPAHPFFQSAWLYSLTLVLAFIHTYTNYVTDNARVPTIVYAAWAVDNLIRWTILFSSPMGDHSARVYTKPGVDSSPEATSSLFKTLTCCWTLDMMIVASKRVLQFDDIWELSERNHTYKIYESYKKTNAASHFVWRMVSAFRFELSMHLLMGISGAILSMVPTVFVNLILRYLEDDSSIPRHVAWLYVFGIGFSQVFQDVVENQAFYYGRRLSVLVRAVLMGEIYHKALFREMSTEQDEESEEQQPEDKNDDDLDLQFDANNSGAILNLMSVDTFKIAEQVSYCHFNISSPIAVAISTYFLWRVLHWSALAGVGIMVLSLPLNYVIAEKIAKINEDLMAVTDKRVDKTNEVLSAIRIIKFFAWETKFVGEIFNLRTKELHLLYVSFMWRIVSATVFFLLPILFTLVSFSCYVLIEGKTLTSSVAFTSLSIFSILRYPLDDVANMISSLASAKVSVDRIKEFLEVSDSPKYAQLDSKQPRGPDSPAIGIEKATLRWGKLGRDQNSFKLRDINVSFLEGDLNVVIGPTGSGKTSLLLALLGEMYLETGKIFLPSPEDRSKAKVDPVTGLSESIAYCPQQAWLVNDTVRNNIVFSAPFDRRRYDAVVQACQLERDFEILADGDQTLIGDKGITLSGGQKQRVSMARALYSNSRHLILDDCLSAVDSHTAEALYKVALTGPIGRNRTIILVSHNVALTISQAAKVIVMSNGRITAQGSPAELSAKGLLGDDDLVLKSARESVISRTNSSSALAQLADHTAQPVEDAHAIPEPDNVLAEEERGFGSIPLSTYVKFAQALGSVSWWVIFVASMMAVPITQYIQSWWLKSWTSAGEEQNLHSVVLSKIQAFDSLMFGVKNTDEGEHDIMFYIAIYALIGLGVVIVSVLREFLAFSGSVRASKKLFRQLLDSVIHARIRFFDSTPVGRIINRFSKDVETVDQEMVPQTIFLISSVLDALAVGAVVSYLIPPLIPAMFVVIWIYIVFGSLYLNCSRELKRFESTSRSPIFQQFGEILTGAVTIRAFGDTTRFLNLNRTTVDTSHRPYFYLWLSNRWLAFWSFIISAGVSVVTALFLIWKSDQIASGTAGIALTYSMMFGDAILWITRSYSQVEINLNSVERIEEYIDIEHEAPAVIPESRPPPAWPHKGEVEFKNLSLRYADDLPMVIKDVSFVVGGGMKVGVVGRTGAGKSTIITALFRMLEPAGGSITIDGLDISTIGLDDLRNGLSIIPQDPTLFNGTLRSNMDPFNENDDNSIFTALSRVRLVPLGTTAESAASAAVAEGENANKFLDLDSEITEGGNNLSQGQRQLVCLARSILKAPRILLLDEATASIDYETDAMIQTTIREEFTDVTILTIAHRLRTIADYDRILVLDKGQLAQFGHPAELLRDKKGLFYSMAEKSGEMEALVSLANKAESA